jgi:hypothetical protein
MLAGWNPLILGLIHFPTGEFPPVLGDMLFGFHNPFVGFHLGPFQLRSRGKILTTPKFFI